MADRMKKVGGRGAWVDRAMAAFAGGAAGFFTFMMPANLAGGMIAIGTQTGRVAVSMAVAVATFLGVSLLLRALSGPVGRRSNAVRVRRADMHPDAPAPTPILAASELGVPLDHVEVDARTADAIDLDATEDIEEASREGLPFWMPEDAAPDAGSGVEDWPPELVPVDAAPGEASALPFWFDDPVETGEPPLASHAERPPKVKVIDHGGIESLVERLEPGVVHRSRGSGPPGEGGAVRAPDRQLEERLRGAIKDLRRAASG